MRIMASVLESISKAMLEEMEDKDRAREEAFRRSREVVRLCSSSIRSVHRGDLELGHRLMEEAGAGLDIQAGKGFKISADAYDPNDFRIKLRSEIRLAPDTYLVGETLSLNKDAQRSSYVGIRRNF